MRDSFKEDFDLFESYFITDFQRVIVKKPSHLKDFWIDDFPIDKDNGNGNQEIYERLFIPEEEYMELVKLFKKYDIRRECYDTLVWIHLIIFNYYLKAEFIQELSERNKERARELREFQELSEFLSSHVKKIDSKDKNQDKRELSKIKQIKIKTKGKIYSFSNDLFLDYFTQLIAYPEKQIFKHDIDNLQNITLELNPKPQKGRPTTTANILQKDFAASLYDFALLFFDAKEMIYYDTAALTRSKRLEEISFSKTKICCFIYDFLVISRISDKSSNYTDEQKEEHVKSSLELRKYIKSEFMYN